MKKSFSDKIRIDESIKPSLDKFYGLSENESKKAQKERQLQSLFERIMKKNKESSDSNKIVS